MGRLDDAFAAAKTEHRAAFIAYITAGDPTLESTGRLMRAFEKSGVDIVELGVPYSDPVADGPVNQDAAMRALQNDVHIGLIFDMVREVRRDSGLPVIFFMYYNSLLQYGIDKFVKDAAQAGVDGALVLDLPPEESAEYKRLMDEAGLATVFLVSPITPDDRLKKITKLATGFVYYVSQMGVTGERSEIAGHISEKAAAIRELTDVPVAVGFGISKPEHVKEVAESADGVIVGSAIVHRIAEGCHEPGFEEKVAAYVQTLTAPLKGARDG